jgi:hypothetical protein
MVQLNLEQPGSVDHVTYLMPRLQLGRTSVCVTDNAQEAGFHLTTVPARSTVRVLSMRRTLAHNLEKTWYSLLNAISSMATLAFVV